MSFSTTFALLAVHIGERSSRTPSMLTVGQAFHQSGFKVTALFTDKGDVPPSEAPWCCAAPLTYETLCAAPLSYPEYLPVRPLGPNELAVIPSGGNKSAAPSAAAPRYMLRARTVIGVIPSVLTHVNQRLVSNLRRPMALIVAPHEDSPELYHLAVQRVHGVVYVLSEESPDALARLNNIHAGIRKARGGPFRHIVLSVGGGNLYHVAALAPPIDQRLTLIHLDPVRLVPVGAVKIPGNDLANTFGDFIGHDPNEYAEAPGPSRELDTLEGAPTNAANVALQEQARVRGRELTVLVKELDELVPKLPTMWSEVGGTLHELIQRIARRGPGPVIVTIWDHIERVEQLLNDGMLREKPVVARLNLAVARLIRLETPGNGVDRAAELSRVRSLISGVTRHSLTHNGRLQFNWTLAYYALVSGDLTRRKVVLDDLEDLKDTPGMELGLWLQRRVECRRMYAEVTGARADWEEVARQCEVIAITDASYGLHGLAIALWRLGRDDEAHTAAARLMIVDPTAHKKLMQDKEYAVSGRKKP